MEIKLGSAWEKLGITRSDVTENIGEALKNEAVKDASEIEKLFKKKAATEEAAATQETTEDDDCPECHATMDE